MLTAVLLLSGCDPRTDLTSESPKTPETHLTAQVKAAPAEPGAAPRTFAQIAALPDEQFDVAEAVLALGAESRPDIDIGATLQALDAMAAKARADLPENPDGTDYFDGLYEFVLDRRAASPFREDRAEDYDLSFTVLKHRGSCLSTGIMALAVARRIGAPVWGVQCPAHFFLRYIPPEDRKAGVKEKTKQNQNKSKHKDIPLNFDATRPMPENWQKLDDDFYRNLLHLDSHAEANGAYLRPLTDRETVSAFLSSRSGYFAMKKDFEHSYNDASRALALNPNNITGCINAGLALESLKRYDEAEQAYAHALRIDSNYVKALNNLAYLKVRDPESSVYSPRSAEKLIETALKRDPDRAYLHATEGEVKAAGGDWRAAARAMDQAARMEPKNKQYRARFLYFRSQLRGETGQ